MTRDRQPVAACDPPACRDCAGSIEPRRPNAERCVPCGIAHERWMNVERKRKRRRGA